jgi:hypothetical protein
VLLRAVAVGQDRDETVAVGGRDIDDDTCGHALESHA